MTTTAPDLGAVGANIKARLDAVPTKTSQLTNDSGFLTQHQDLSAYAKTTDLSAYAKTSAIPTSMAGASESAAGKAGIVPAPSAGDQEKFLKGDGTWGAVSSGGGTSLPGAGSAPFSNSIWGGRDLLTIYTETQITDKIAAGDFSNLFVGDYITKAVTVSGTTYTKKWYCADFDYYLGRGSTEITKHHIVMVPESYLGTAAMNSSNTTSGGFAGSAMWKTTLPLYATGIKDAFGSAHVLSHKHYMSDTVSTSISATGVAGATGAVSTYGTWNTATVMLMSEPQVFGTTLLSSSGYDVGADYGQLSLFRLNPSLIQCRYAWWLSAVASSTNFVVVGYNGDAHAYGASASFGVRPLFLWA